MMMQWKKWEDIPLEEVNRLLSRRLIWGKEIMVAHVFLKKGCVVPTHQHENEQITQVFSGRLRFWLGEAGAEREIIINPGEVLVIPGNMPHKAEALEDTLDVDIFSPPRADWIDGSDAYLRK